MNSCLILVIQRTIILHVEACHLQIQILPALFMGNLILNPKHAVTLGRVRYLYKLYSKELIEGNRYASRERLVMTQCPKQYSFDYFE